MTTAQILEMNRCIQTLEKLPGLIRDAEDRLVDAYEQLNHAKNVDKENRPRVEGDQKF